MTRFSAMLDACVLVPVTLADTLLRLAENGLYRPLWSARIIDETVQAIEEVHPQLSADAIRRRATAMDTAFGDASVTGWEALEDAISLPDADDCHVVAAAVMGRADVIVTKNVKDYPPNILEPYRIEVQDPDVFLLHQLDLAPSTVMSALWRQARSSHRPQVTLEALLDRLAVCGAPNFAHAAKAQIRRLAAEGWSAYLEHGNT
jgi:toxin-antitoxin system, toxin component, PIN family